MDSGGGEEILAEGSAVDSSRRWGGGDDNQGMDHQVHVVDNLRPERREGRPRPRRAGARQGGSEWVGVECGQREQRLFYPRGRVTVR